MLNELFLVSPEGTIPEYAWKGIKGSKELFTQLNYQGKREYNS
jgi:hypothetical protein